jgi:hypothetical protein
MSVLAGGPSGEEHNAVQGWWDGGQPGNAAPMPAATTATPVEGSPPAKTRRARAVVEWRAQMEAELDAAFARQGVEW